jgi:hypothetical protein
MSTLGKVLAILNVFAALGLVCLAALDWGQRQAWSYAVFRHDLVLHGLPIDDKDTDADGVPTVAQLGDATLNKIFENAGGQPVKTQVEEVQRKQRDLRGQIDAIDAANEAARAEKLRKILRPLVRTGGERDALDTAKPDKLEDLFQSAFKGALDGKDAQDKPLDGDQRRLAIAHLLFNSSDDQDHPRVLAVVGLETYARLVEGQAQALREMARFVEHAMVEDRTSFVIQHKPMVQRVLVLSDRVADLKGSLDQYLAEKAKHQEFVNARLNDVKELEARIAAAKTATQEALKEQARLEQVYFQAQRAVGQAVAENQQLEKQIRARERAE